MFFPPNTRHVQSTPEGWPELTAQTASRLTAEGALPAEAALAMHDTLTTIDGQHLEELRYYGLGEVALGCARQLSDPDAQEGLVARGAQIILDKHGEYCDARNYPNPGGGLYYWELPRLDKAMRPLSQAAQTARPLPDARLTDLLEAHSVARRKQRQQGRATLFEESAAPKLIVGDNAAAGRIDAASFAGISSIMHLVFESHIRVGTDKRALLLRDITDFARLSAPDAIRFAQTAALMHIDRFTKPEVQRAMAQDADGEIRFDRSRLDQPISEAPVTKNSQGIALHHTAIDCPALFVRHLIPSLMQLGPVILQRADDRLRSAASS
jgi:hypothetical protein